jgi:hypothetical protein
MDPVKLSQLLHRQPFVPFRVVLKDGQTYDVRHGHLAFVRGGYLDIYAPAPDEPEPIRPHPICEHQAFVGLGEIDRVEELSLPGVKPN